LNTGGGLTLSRQGLSPCKMHQASLGALTPQITSSKKHSKEGAALFAVRVHLPWSNSQKEPPPKALTDTGAVSIQPAPIIQPFHPNHCHIIMIMAICQSSSSPDIKERYHA
ncbi:MAG: hypothetical protein KZQ99_21130, partial [Candidatus Thiodiazotropha sp. (ex Dulcina madagascariensis)]|nr:hypothetical protein [Candidatus Thiodiazotropha sp. (ex Dulcina madagascariensis)]